MRTLKLCVIGIVVFSSYYLVETTEVFHPVDTARGDENLTWDMVNQSINESLAELKKWFQTVYIIQINVSIDKRMSDLLSRLNLTIEEYNETTVVSRLRAIEKTLGYPGNSSDTIYTVTSHAYCWGL
jgi:uncharacterized protein YcbK (DUF882 family)